MYKFFRGRVETLFSQFNAELFFSYRKRKFSLSFVRARDNIVVNIFWKFFMMKRYPKSRIGPLLWLNLISNCPSNLLKEIFDNKQDFIGQTWNRFSVIVMKLTKSKYIYVLNSATVAINFMLCWFVGIAW